MNKICIDDRDINNYINEILIRCLEDDVHSKILINSLSNEIYNNHFLDLKNNFKEYLIFVCKNNNIKIEFENINKCNNCFLEKCECDF